MDDTACRSFPLGEALGLQIDIPDPGRSIASVQTTPEHLNPHGAIHGAVLFALVDTGMGGAAVSVLEPEEMCASIEVHLRFLRAVFEGELRADTHVVHRGRRIIQLESRVENTEGRLVATATGSFAVIPRNAV